MHFVVNIIHWFFRSLYPRMLLSSLMKLLYSPRFLALFLHCCQFLLYSSSFSVQKLCLLPCRVIQIFWIILYSPQMAASVLTSLADHEEPHNIAVALILIFVVACYSYYTGLPVFFILPSLLYYSLFFCIALRQPFFWAMHPLT